MTHATTDVKRWFTAPARMADVTAASALPQLGAVSLQIGTGGIFRLPNFCPFSSQREGGAIGVIDLHSQWALEEIEQVLRLYHNFLWDIKLCLIFNLIVP